MPPDRTPSVLHGQIILKDMYEPSAIYADTVDVAAGIGTMLVTPGRANRRRQLVLDRHLFVDRTTSEVGITILPEHSEGHFPSGSELPLIIQGHKAMRLAGAALQEIAAVNAPNQPSYSTITGFDHATFRRPIIVGDEVVIKAQLTEEPQPNEQGLLTFFKGTASLYVRDELKSRFRGLTIEKKSEPQTEPILKDQIFEFAAQSWAVALLAERPEELALLVSIGRTRFTGLDAVPDKTLIAITQSSIQEGQRFFASSIVADEEGNHIADIKDIQAAVRASRLIKFALGR